MSSIIVRLHEIFRQGSSAPARAETADGGLYAIKFKGAGGGEHALVTEFLALAIARALGVRAPAALPLYLPAQFPWQTGTDEFDAMVKRSAGWNLGIALIPDARPAPLADLDDAFLAPLARADQALVNVDRPAGNPNILADAGGAAWAIDFDACLFARRLLNGGAQQPDALPATHFLAGSAHDRAARARVPAETLRDAVAALPDAWLAALGADRGAFTANLEAYCGA